MRLLFSASLRFALDDRGLFASKILERLRSTPLGSFAESVQRRMPGLSTSSSSVQRDFERKNFSKLAALAGSELLDDYSRNDTKLIKRAVELDTLLDHEVVGSSPKPTDQEMPRVLFYLTNSLPHTFSGYAYRSQSILKSLQRQGILVRAVTRLGYPITVGRFPGGPEEVIDGVMHSRLIPAKYSSSLLRRFSESVDHIERLAIEHNANILHTTTDYNNALIVAEAAKRLSIPWVYEIRGELEKTWLSKQESDVRSRPEASEFYTRARSLETECMKAANAVIALSQVSKAQLIKRGVAPAKIQVVPNAVDEAFVGMDYSKEQIRRELNLPPGKIVGSVTSVVEYEGLDDLVRALTKGLDATVLIVGDGVFLPRLRQLAMELGVSNQVIFAGRQDNAEIWRWYASMDIFVIPRKDTLVCRTVTPIKPVMAQALGVPVVASDLPALREITGGYATYVAPENSEELAHALNSIEPIKGNLPEIVDWAKSHTWKSNAIRISEMYNRLLKPE